MLRTEFENLTGIYPSENMYAVIEKFYSESNTDKWGFCAAYAANTDYLAERIQTEANRLEQAREQSFASRVHELKSQTEATEKALEREKKASARLRLQLDKELDWKPAEHTGTNMNQSDYEELANMPDAYLTDEKAVSLISELFGFMPEKIRIRHHAGTFEVNKYGRLRLMEAYQREPRYAATDWNYIRFDCAGMQWELVNGNLMPYED